MRCLRKAKVSLAFRSRPRRAHRPVYRTRLAPRRDYRSLAKGTSVSLPRTEDIPGQSRENSADRQGDGASRANCGTICNRRLAHALPIATETDGFLVGPAAFKAVARYAECLGCVRFAHVSAIFSLFPYLAHPAEDARGLHRPHRRMRSSAGSGAAVHLPRARRAAAGIAAYRFSYLDRPPTQSSRPVGRLLALRPWLQLGPNRGVCSLCAMPLRAYAP